jgi:hypothetical protein
MDKLMRIPYFERAYDENGYTRAEYNTHPALVKTARRVLKGHQRDGRRSPTAASRAAAHPLSFLTTTCFDERTMSMTDINVTDLFVPWLETAPEYNTSILDKAWAQPDYGRMMLNENPVPPSDKVVNAVTEIVKKGNRYPDSMLRLRTKLGALHGVGPENIALANGSSETIDAMMRIFLQPGDEFLLSNPTFEMFPSRAGLCGAKTCRSTCATTDCSTTSRACWRRSTTRPS